MPCRPARTAAPALLAAVLAAAAALPLAAMEVPYLAGRVNDLADMIPAEARQRLEDSLRDLEDRTTVQMAVLTVPSLEGDSLEDFSMRVAETWQLGQRDKDNGVLLLVARDERAMRLEVGYGLEGTLSDALSGRILDTLVRPRFRAGDFAGGIGAAVDAVATAVEGGDPVPAGSGDSSFTGMQGPLLARLVAGLLFAVVITPFSLIAVFGKGCQSWFLYLFLIPFWAMFPAAIVHPFAGLATLGLWLVGFPVARWIFGSTRFGKAFRASHPGLVTMATSRGGSGGSFSSGGFSGGGGSFGGGGASSSW